jgi:Spy/CpxP family protein refolding chaperone
MKKLLVLPAALLLALPLAVRADGENKDDWIRGKLFAPELILKSQSKLRLTDKQRAAIGLELKRVQAQAAESDWQIMSEGLEVQELIDRHPVDARDVLARVDRVLEAETRKKRLYVEMLVNIKNLLTPEQVSYLRSVAE